MNLRIGIQGYRRQNSGRADYASSNGPNIHLLLRTPERLIQGRK